MIRLSMDYQINNKEQGKMKNKYTMIINSSKGDIYGNRYGYIDIVDNDTGKTKSYKTGWCDSGASNEKSIAHRLGDCNIVMRSDIPIRQFNRESKGLTHLNTSGNSVEKAEMIKELLK